MSDLTSFEKKHSCWVVWAGGGNTELWAWGDRGLLAGGGGDMGLQTKVDKIWISSEN